MMTGSTLDTVQCLLMGGMAARMHWSEHSLFWEILPDIVPDLTIHMPALTSAVRGVSRENKGNWNWLVLHFLSSHRLPATLSSETVDWRREMVTTWEKQLKWARETLDSWNRDGQDGKAEMEWEWKHRYILSLKGLTQVDRCDLLPGMTCPSVLPTLLGEAHAQRFKTFEQFEQLKCLAALSDWHPGLNVLTDRKVLNEWGGFWLELYQQGDMDTEKEEPRIQIIKKGIAAKALLNLVETGRKEETVVPTGLETALLESLTMAVNAVGEIRNNSYHLDWLSWQPRDATRFPTDRLAKLPETLLNIFTLSCQNTHESTYNPLRKIRRDSLTELVRWNRSGLSADCGIDLLPAIVTGISNYLNKFSETCYFQSEYLLSHELCRWLVREEVANVEGGRELLLRLGSRWESESMSKYSDSDALNSRSIAWTGRMRLQQIGLATETPDVFHNDLLEAIKQEETVAVRLVLSLWRPGKDTPDRVRRRWEHLLEKKLKSNDGEIVLTAVQAFLRPDPANDPVDWWQKVRNILSALPEPVCPKLFVAEIMHLMGELPLENQRAGPNQMWQFRPDETRFRIPTEHVVSISTLGTVPTARPDRTAQKSAGSERHPGVCY